MRWALKRNWDSDKWRRRFRGAAGATESTVNKGLCWDESMPRREEGL